MASLTTSIIIAASPEQVFDAFADVPNWPENVGAIRETELLTDGPVGVGTRFRETRIMFKKEATEEMEFTEFERPRVFTVVANSCGAHYVTVHRFTPEGSGTKVTIEFEATPVTFMAKLFSPLTGLMLKSCVKMFDRDMEDMRSKLEGQSVSGEAEAQAAGGSS